MEQMELSQLTINTLRKTSKGLEALAEHYSLREKTKRNDKKIAKLTKKENGLAKDEFSLVGKTITIYVGNNADDNNKSITGEVIRAIDRHRVTFSDRCYVEHFGRVLPYMPIHTEGTENGVYVRYEIHDN